MRLGELMATYASVGSLLGSLEALVRVAISQSPSMERRAPGLILTAAILYAVSGAAVALLHAGITRVRQGAGHAVQLASVEAVLLLCPFAFLVLMGDRRFYRAFVPTHPTWILPVSLVVGGVMTAALFVYAYLLVSGAARWERIPALLLRRWRRGMVGAGVACAALAAAGLVWSGPWRLPLGAIPARAAGLSHPDRPNVVLILIDTLRADRLGAYGYKKIATPGTDALAARGVVFENAYSACSWTTPSVVSMLTSRYPSEHGVTNFDSSAPRDLPILPQLLAESGYTTAGVVSNPLLDHRRGFDRGYDVYDKYPGELERSLAVVAAANRTLRAVVHLPLHTRVRLYPRFGLVYPPRFRIGLSDYVRGDEVTDLALETVDELPAAPFFLYVHYGDPHTPYLLHPFGIIPRTFGYTRERLPEVIAAYDGEVHFVDGQVARFLDGLRARGLLKNTIVALVADHGEEFLEHGVWEHGHNLHEQVLRVPIIMAGPGMPEGVRRIEPVSLLDVAPTILDLLGLPPGKGFKGIPLLAGGGEPNLPSSRPLLAQVSQLSLSHTRQASILLDNWRYIRHRDRKGELVQEELFDRAVDPQELHDLSGTSPERLEAMRKAMAAVEATLQNSKNADREEDERTLERLRSLGYID